MKPRHSQKKPGHQPRHEEAKRKPRYEEIARLAYELYEKEGRPDGKDLEHWFNAESMIEGNFGYGSDHSEHDFSKETDGE